MQINTNYLKLADSYLFSDIAKRIAAFSKANPDKRVIRLGIGDATQPLCPAVVEALKKASDEMGVKATFKGYGPEQGYDFLRTAIVAYYKEKGVELQPDEVFVSDGAKSDLGNILDIFSESNKVLIPDPVYPVYVDTNVMAGRSICYIDANEANGFLPVPTPQTDVDIIYLCSPNNPTGAVYNREQLKLWVDYARSHDAVILFDAAYESFVSNDELPRSIYEIPGAKECAIEFCSFSKTAGFTGVRCGYTVLPKTLVRGGVVLNKLWLRRQTTKFNGVPYVVQRAAEAVLTPEGREQLKPALEYYRRNAQAMVKAFGEMGAWFTGGANSPYIWIKCPAGMDSWAYFDYLLEKANVAGTPGSGFGKNGEGFFRLTAFGDYDDTCLAMERIKRLNK